MPFYSKEIRDELNNKTSIVDLMKEEGENVSGRGKTLSFQCPKCGGGHDNGKIDNQRNFFTCFRCVALGSKFQGKPINYLQEKYDFSLPEAIEYLANRINYSLPKLKYSKEENIKKNLFMEVIKFYEKYQLKNNYLIERGVDIKTIQKYRIGYAPGSSHLKKHLLNKGFTEEELYKYHLISGKGSDRFYNRFVFPIIKNNVPFDFYSRTVDSHINLKHMMISGIDPIIYGSDYIPNNCNVLDIYESIIDKLVAESNGFPNGIAIGGCTKFTHSLVLFIKRKKPKCIRLILDPDQKGQGQNAAFKIGEVLSKLGYNIKVVILPIGDDAAKVCNIHGKERYEQYLNDAIDFEEYKTHFLLQQLPEELIIKHLNWREKPCKSFLEPDRLKTLFYGLSS